MSTEYNIDDFSLDGGKLRLAQRGPVAVFFMSKSDPKHMQVLQVLKTIRLDKLEIGFLDITKGKNREVIIMSRDTNTPITQLPYLAYFYDTKLKAKYKSDVTKSALERYFLEKMMESATQSASSGKSLVNDPSKKFSMAQQQSSSGGGAGGGGKPVDPRALGGMVGQNVAWRTETAK
uniref:Thioredoxin domain-containing protein n=1 Tax=viral metagenome TaxID=1070528 RepID=A0A6C0JTA6_9ZZZZ